MKKAMLHRLVMVAFCLTVALSGLLLVPATVNYLELYVALSHMHLRINSFNIYTGSAGQSESALLCANLSIVQNSSYVGLRILSVDVLVYYGEDSGYSDLLYSTKFTLGDVSIGPHSSVNLMVQNVSLNVQVFLRFVDYNNQSMARGEPVKLLFSSDANLFILGNPLPNTLYLDDVTYPMPYYVS